MVTIEVKRVYSERKERSKTATISRSVVFNLNNNNTILKKYLVITIIIELNKRYVICK